MNKTIRLKINSDLLQTFHAVADLGNVTQAASRLGRTQSAVSVQIRKLEDLLSVQLFDRGARGVTLTENGTKLLPVAINVLEEVYRAETLFTDPLAGRLKIGIPDDYAETILQRALGQFVKKHSKVEIFTRAGCSEGFPEAIRKNELDLAIFSAGPIPDKNSLYSEPTVWAAHAEFKHKEGEPVPLVLFDRNCWWRNVATDALDQASIKWRVAYLSENFNSVRAAIMSGLGIGILAHSSLDPSMYILDKRAGFPTLPRSSLTLIKNSKTNSKAVQEMENAIRNAIQVS
ncbi:LysR substrate-binding domain-containing protein [Kiloniella sp.]|uniref:LysR substrate-binding domain-containing protein n=1 Tax=Kiloniella sp. TaxID=1938587 RepID=UPI003B024066